MIPQAIEVGASTKLFALLGKPVGHSLSPAMQTAAFKALGIDACYLAFEVEREDLAPVLNGARKMGFGGINITVPHKEAAFALATEVDRTAGLTGAVNTLVPVDTGWKGYNTDVAGFMDALEIDLGFTPRGRRAAILGAGGAARAALVGLAQGGATEIIVAARKTEKAQKLAEELSPSLPSAKLTAMDVGKLPSVLCSGDLLVSATPLGLDPGGKWPWAMDTLERSILVYDMAYSRLGHTSLETQARKAGLVSASGARMLLMQGAKAFALWTGKEPPLARMEEILFKQ